MNQLAVYTCYTTYIPGDFMIPSTCYQNQKNIDIQMRFIQSAGSVDRLLPLSKKGCKAFQIFGPLKKPLRFQFSPLPSRRHVPCVVQLCLSIQQLKGSDALHLDLEVLDFALPCNSLLCRWMNFHPKITNYQILKRTERSGSQVSVNQKVIVFQMRFVRLQLCRNTGDCSSTYTLED